MAFTKLVGKTFTVCRKSMKTAKVFSHIPFIVYSISSRLSKQRINVTNVC